MKTDYEYLSVEKLLPFVGKELNYLVWGDYQKAGVLEKYFHKDKNGKPTENFTLYFPFCGGVDATTVQVKV